MIKSGWEVLEQVKRIQMNIQEEILRAIIFGEEKNYSNYFGTCTRKLSSIKSEYRDFSSCKTKFYNNLNYHYCNNGLLRISKSKDADSLINCRDINIQNDTNSFEIFRFKNGGSYIIDNKIPDWISYQPTYKQWELEVTYSVGEGEVYCFWYILRYKDKPLADVSLSDIKRIEVLYKDQKNDITKVITKEVDEMVNIQTRRIRSDEKDKLKLLNEASQLSSVLLDKQPSLWMKCYD